MSELAEIYGINRTTAADRSKAIRDAHRLAPGSTVEDAIAALRAAKAERRQGDQ